MAVAILVSDPIAVDKKTKLTAYGRIIGDAKNDQEKQASIQMGIYRSKELADVKRGLLFTATMEINKKAHEIDPTVADDKKTIVPGGILPDYDQYLDTISGKTTDEIKAIHYQLMRLSEQVVPVGDGRGVKVSIIRKATPILEEGQKEIALPEYVLPPEVDEE